MQVKRVRVHRRLRRAAVAVYVAISMTVIMGMAALTVDIGALYQGQAELQRVADAAALAGASQLAAEDVQDPEYAAVFAADEVAQMNAVLREAAGLDSAGDVELGRAVYDPITGQFAFEPGGDVFDAVRVTVRRTEGSEAGPIQLSFARFLGHDERGLQARAAAVLVPRDIAVVIDLSNSMCWDSQLRFWDRDDGGYANTRDVWCALDGPEPSRPYLPGSELETEYASDVGPDIGAMSTWGDPLLPGSYNSASDPGLWYIRRYYSTSDSNLISDLVARGYASDEIIALRSHSYDGDSTLWRNRAAAMLGLALWSSGKPGGLYPGGDGDDRVENDELSWIPKPDFRVDWSWTSYINWVQNSGRQSEFRYRYGLKTFTDFLLESEPQYNETNNLWATPEQPLRATKDAVQAMTDVIAALESMDHVSLEIFATTAHHEVNLSGDLQAVPDHLYQMQSAHYDRCTNIGGGLAQAMAELQSGRARPNAHKVIMLMSDGVANVDENGNYLGDGAQAARDYATAQAEQAADLGFRIYTISVGYNVDRALMQEIAAIGNGQEFYAVGSPEEYTEQLEAIFRTLGGKRPVALIE
jgi:hypothetical protein